VLASDAFQGRAPGTKGEELTPRPRRAGPPPARRQRSSY
jgi:hypothetical protein